MKKIFLLINFIITGHYAYLAHADVNTGSTTESTIEVCNHKSATAVDLLNEVKLLQEAVYSELNQYYDINSKPGLQIITQDNCDYANWEVTAKVNKRNDFVAYAKSKLRKETWMVRSHEFPQKIR